MRTLPVALLLALAPALPAAADLLAATVVFDASPVGAAPYAPFTARCAVSTGQALTAAIREAEAEGCVDSVTLLDFGWGNFVACVNGVCGHDAGDESRYWILYENGVPSLLAGADGMSVDAGDSFHVSYDNCRPSLGWTCIPNWLVE